MKLQVSTVSVSLLIVFMLALSTLPAQAKALLYQANGTLDTYNEAVSALAELVVGSWNIEISEDLEVHFKARWLEENTNEEILGTKDRFRLTFTVAEVVSGDSFVEIEGTFVFDKMGWNVTTGIPYSRTQMFEGRITIDSSEIRVYFSPSESDWLIKGSTRSISA